MRHGNAIRISYIRILKLNIHIITLKQYFNRKKNTFYDHLLLLLTTTEQLYFQTITNFNSSLTTQPLWPTVTL